MPPCFLYLSNTWSIVVLLPQFSSVFAWQLKLPWEGLPTRQLFCVLPPIPRPKEARSPFPSVRGSKGEPAPELYRSAYQKESRWHSLCCHEAHEDKRAEQSPKTGGITGTELMYRKAQTMVVGWGVPRDTMVTELKTHHHTALARTQKLGNWECGKKFPKSNVIHLLHSRDTGKDSGQY